MRAVAMWSTSMAVPILSCDETIRRDLVWSFHLHFLHLDPPWRIPNHWLLFYRPIILCLVIKSVQQYKNKTCAHTFPLGQPWSKRFFRSRLFCWLDVYWVSLSMYRWRSIMIGTRSEWMNRLSQVRTNLLWVVVVAVVTWRVGHSGQE